MNQLDRIMYKTFEREYDVHYFNITEDTKKLLSKTNFTNNTVKLPFSRIRINIQWEDKEGNKYPYIYVIETEDSICIDFVRIPTNMPFADMGLLELNKNLTSKKKKTHNDLIMVEIDGKDVSKLPHHQKVELSKAAFDKYDGGYDKEVKITNESENLMVKFVGNFINLINSRDVELITFERSEEQNIKRMRRGKLPIPQTTHIRLIGKIKEYVNKLKSSGEINYSHSFWVRGHWRTLRNENRYGDKAGTMIWITPYIKGDGKLIKKIYDVES